MAVSVINDLDLRYSVNYIENTDEVYMFGVKYLYILRSKGNSGLSFKQFK